MMEPYNVLPGQPMPDVSCAFHGCPSPVPGASRLHRPAVMFLACVVSLGFVVPTPSRAQGTNLPNGWTARDIGSPGVAGSTSTTNGVWTVSGSGSDIWGASDQFQFAYQSFGGDGTMVAYVASEGNTDPWAKSGLMFRSSTAANDLFAALVVTPGNGVVLEWRKATGSNFGLNQAPSITAPVWLKLVRSGNNFTGYYSVDSTNWTQVGSTQTVAVAALATVGLCVDSHNNTNLNTSTFSNVSLSAVFPSGWLDNDIGSPGIPGSASYASGNGTWVVSGGGADIGGSTDQFNSLSQPLNGDGSVIAQIGSQSNTGPGAQAGVMIRGDSTPTSAFAYVGVTPSNSVSLQYRSTAGTNISSIAADGTIASPIWVRLTRVANSFSASFSYDGANWDELGVPQTVSLGAIAQAGLAVSASNNAAISTATFSNVCVVPSGWSDTDIGSPGVAGSASFDGSNFTVGGGGANIWGTSDQFNFASQSYVGDVAIIAKVNSLTNGAANAKAGVMIRDGLGANASYAFMLLTPNNGGGSPAANFEYRNGSGSNSQAAASATGISAPYWVKLVRQGNTFTASYSADGVTWVQNGSSIAIPMSATIQIGVAVDANNNTALTTAAFGSVSVTPATWSDTDVGSPAVTGSARFDGLTWSINGSGYDFGGGTDQLNFASQSFAGDVTVVAQVGGLVNASTNAGAGVMIRDGATVSPSASYAYVFFTPSDTTNGQDVVLEYRNSAGVTAQVAGSTAGVAAPNWVKLVRSGNSFSAYYSTDGVTWTQTGPAVSIPMGLTTQVGLAVSSNNTNALTSATFANVSVGTFQTDLFLKQNGRDMRNGHGNGDVVPLHGVNIGTWLMYEPSFGPMDSSGMQDAYTVYNTLTTRFGVAGRNRVEDSYQFNWITTADLDEMRSWGMTCIRVPFWYLNLIELDGTWRSDAFTHLDWIVNEAWKRGIYTVLDFHGLPGGDCPWASCGQIQNSGQFFAVYSNQVEAATIWSNLAAHFKGHPGIAAYDLMNEPNSSPDSGTLWNIYNWYFWTIRGIDPDHTIQMEGNWDWSTLPNPSWYGWYNVAYHTHAYAFGANGTYDPTTAQVDGAAWGALASYQSFFSYNIPDYIGEFAGNSDPSSFEYEHAVFNSYGVGWANWTWKAEGGSNDEWADTIPYNWPWVPNLQTDSMATILSDYTTIVTPGHYQANPLLQNTMAEPYAAADTYALTEDQSLYVTATSGVLSNDIDVNAYQLSAELVNNVSHGTLTLWSDGSFYYTPTPGFVGTDTFRYRAADANSWSPNTITVTLIVQPGSPTTLPSGWNNTDIGSPGLAGSTTFNWSNATWTVAGSGGDIWNGTDQFQYAYQSLTGNGAIVARVTSVQNTDPWAKVGVMFRETLDPSSRDAMMAITYGNGAIFEWRSIANGSTSGSTSNGISAPYWVMLQRAGSVFTGYVSSNGVAWMQVGSATMVMASTADVGLAVTAHNNSSVNPASIDNVTLTPAPGAPSGLTATPGDGQVALSWTLSSGATSYNVERAPFGGSFAIITNVTGTAYVDHSVTDGTTYYYVVTAVNTGGVSGNSNEVGTTPSGYQQWMNQYFSGNPSLGATNIDADGTGQNNQFKYVAGLDPTNPSSVFQLVVQPVATNEPTWMGLTYNPIVAGRTYTIEFSTNYPSGPYTPLTGASTPQTNGSQVTVIDLNAIQSNKFYRVHISLP